MTCSHLLARLNPGTPCTVCKVEVAAIDAGLPGRLAVGPTVMGALTAADPVAAFKIQTGHPDPLQGLEVDEAVELLRRLDEDACRGSLYEFVRCAFEVMTPGTPLEDGPHIRAICDHVQWQLEDRAACVRDPARKLRAQDMMINVPPRSLKTTILTCATVWAWLRWPTMRIMYLSANPRVAQNSARDTRLLITSEWFQNTFHPAWQIRTDQNALSDLGNTAGGARIARGLDSAITGEGCHWLIIDDPHDARDGKDEIAKAVEGYSSAVHNRINDPRTSIRTCIMQRIRVGDFGDMAIDLAWLHVRIPSEFEVESNCRCKKCDGVNVFGWRDWRTVAGEPIHPRFTPEFLETERARLGSRYIGQHQQRPAEAGGELFQIHMWDWCSLTSPERSRWRELQASTTKIRTTDSFVIPRRRDGSLDLDFVCLSGDMTFGSTSDTASGVALVLVGGKGQRRFVLADYSPGPRRPAQQIQDLKDAIVSAAALCGRQRRFTILVEKKALGESAMESIETAIKEADLKYPDDSPIVARVEPYEPTGKGDKDVRAELMEPDIAAGLVYLMDGAAWLVKFLAEVGAFPKGDRDDRVDALAQALDHFRHAKAAWRSVFSN